MKISELMRREPVTLRSTQSLATALAVMKARSIRHIPVVESGHLLGLVTERDAWRAMHEIRLDPAEIELSEVMSRPVVTCRPTDEVSAALEAMLPAKLGCLPVLSEGVVVGIVTAGDLLQYAKRLVQRLEALDGTPPSA